MGAHLRPTQPSSPQYIRALHDFQVHSAPAPPRGLDQGPRLTDLPKRVSSHSLQGDKHHARYGDRRHAQDQLSASPLKFRSGAKQVKEVSCAS